MATLAECAQKVNKLYNCKSMVSISNLIPKYSRLACGALGMDYPLFGGLPYGRIEVYSGLQHSGKTTAACCELAAYQRANPDKKCLYVDVEHTLDLQFQSIMNGVDLSKMYYFNPDILSGEQILDQIVEMEKEAEDIGLIVLDSIPALLPSDVLGKDLSHDAGMRGTIAKTLHKFLIEMQMLLSKKQNILILINQVRVVGTSFTGAPIYGEPGGDGPRYYSSVSVRFGTRTFTKGEDMDACKPDGEGADGFRLKFKITKNKTAPCNRGGGFITYRYATGMDWIHDVLEIATKFDFIHRVNNITYELINLETGEVYIDKSGKPLRSKKSELIKYIQDNPDFQTEYLTMLNRFISSDEKSYGSILDAREAAEISAQEASVEDNITNKQYKQKFVQAGSPMPQPDYILEKAAFAGGAPDITCQTTLEG